MLTSGTGGINLSADKICTIQADGGGEIQKEEKEESGKRRVSDEGILLPAGPQSTESINYHLPPKYIEARKAAENWRFKILKRKREVCSIIYNFRKSASTYSSENAIDFVNLEKEINNHFRHASNQVKRNAREVFERFKGNTIQKYEREMNKFTDILEKLMELKKKNDANLAITLDNFINNGNFDLTSELSELEGEVPAFETKLFELKFDNEVVEIVSRNVPWNLVIVFGPYFNEYIEQNANAHNKQLSENRFETSDGVAVYWKEEDFEAYYERTYHGIGYKILENTQLVFTIPNNWSRSEIDKIQELMKENENNDIKIGIKAEINDAINPELNAWLEDNHMQYFRIYDKLIEDIKKWHNQNKAITDKNNEYIGNWEQRFTTYAKEIDRLENEVLKHFKDACCSTEIRLSISEKFESLTTKLIAEYEAERSKYKTLEEISEDIERKCAEMLNGNHENIPKAFQKLNDLLELQQQSMKEVQTIDRRDKNFELHFGNNEFEFAIRQYVNLTDYRLS